MPLEKVTSEPNLEGGEGAVSRQHWSRYTDQPVWACGSAVCWWARVASVASVPKAGHTGHCESHHSSSQESELSKSLNRKCHCVYSGFISKLLVNLRKIHQSFCFV